MNIYNTKMLMTGVNEKFRSWEMQIIDSSIQMYFDIHIYGICNGHIHGRRKILNNNNDKNPLKSIGHIPLWKLGSLSFQVLRAAPTIYVGGWKEIQKRTCNNYSHLNTNSSKSLSICRCSPPNPCHPLEIVD